MAPSKQVKRAAKAAPAPEPNKRPKKETELEQKCEIVAGAVRLAEDLPEVVRDMLSNVKMLKESVGIPQNSRHAIQEEVVTMLAEVLGGVGAAFQNKVDAAQEAKDAGERERQELLAAEQTTLGTLDATQTAKTEREEAHTQAVAASKAAQLALSEAEREQRDGDADLELAGGRKSRFEALRSSESAYSQLKAGNYAGEDSAVVINDLVSLGKEFAFDDNLLNTLPSSLSKDPDARGSFGLMVITQFDEELSKAVSELSAKIASGESAKAARAETVAQAVAAKEAADREAEATQAAKAAAAGELAAAEAAHREAAKTLKAYAPTKRRLDAAVNAAVGEQQAFREGPLATFEAMAAHTTAAAEKEAEVAAGESATAEPAAAGA